MIPSAFSSYLFIERKREQATALLTFANCNNRLEGSREVVMTTLGSYNPTREYSSSMFVPGSADCDRDTRGEQWATSRPSLDGIQRYQISNES